jgi:hypothetical protein
MSINDATSGVVRGAGDLDMDDRGEADRGEPGDLGLIPSIEFDRLLVIDGLALIGSFCKNVDKLIII